MPEILLGTIAIEPNRWSEVTQDRRATIRVVDWLDRIAGAGFDGIELWEPHIRECPEAEATAIIEHPLPIGVFNTYVGFDDESDDAREATAGWIRRTAAPKVKWNTGAARDDAAVTAYGDRLARWGAMLPGVTLACECHDGSAMDEPAAAAAVLAAGPAERSRAMLHSNDGEARIRAKFAAYGERIDHVHVNHLDAGSPPLAEQRAATAATVALLDELGFRGDWTIEFVHGTFDRDQDPARLFDQAVDDLAVLRELLG